MLLELNPLFMEPFIQANPEFIAVPNEDLLNVQMSILTQQEAYDHVIKCNSRIQLMGQDLGVLQICEIPLLAFKNMFEEATSKRKNSDNYITALKIYMASKATKMTPIFQPVYLKRLRYDPATQKELYQIPSYGHGGFYEFCQGEPATGSDPATESEFKPITDSDRTTLITNYTKKDMTMVHRSGESYKSFILDTDVESCLFPFQTIYKIMQETPSSKIFLTNAIREVGYDLINPNKHVFILSGEVIDKDIPLQAKYANRSHLCPPCNSVDFGFDLAI
jgi:hypothetical protein